MRDRNLRLIALLKFGKATLLVAVGLGAMRLLDGEVARRAQRWASAFGPAADLGLVQRLMTLPIGQRTALLEGVTAGALLLATLFTIEGVGLWLARRWAEYLTAIGTGALLPVELYELGQQFTLSRLVGFGLNVAVTTYLLYRLRRYATGLESPGSDLHMNRIGSSNAGCGREAV